MSDKTNLYLSLLRRISRYTNDSNRLYYGCDDEDLLYETVGSIKAVKLG